MAFLAPLAGELVLDAEAGLGAGSVLQGAETIASQFKNEVIKSIPFGLGEGAAFEPGVALYHHIKKDLGLEKPEDGTLPPPPPPRKPKKRRVGG